MGETKPLLLEFSRSSSSQGTHDQFTDNIVYMFSAFI